MSNKIMSILHGNKIDYENFDLNEIIKNFCYKNPEKIAISLGMNKINYQELLIKINKYTHYLSLFNIEKEQPIGILIEPSIENIIVQLAILGVGGTCVPLDKHQPNLRLKQMLNNININIVITQDLDKNRLNVINTITVNDLNQHKNTDIDLVSLNIIHRTHILHTSGTTGTPKAVQIQAKGILRLAYNHEFSPFYENDHVAHISNPTFDASLFEIYGALLNGATLCIIPKQTILDSHTFKEAIQKNKIDVMAITTALFNLIGTAKPEAFTGIRTIIVGGEPANAFIMKKVLQHSHVQNLRNGYGPTECTTYATTRHATFKYLENKLTIDIGTPIENTSIYILNEQKELIPQGEQGEIYISGDGVARCYANNDAENNEKFLNLHLQGQDVYVYRTGDLGLITQEGFIQCLGRRDNQIKIRGHRINLEEIENEILNTKLVKSVVVDFVKPEDHTQEIYLKAYLLAENEQFDPNVLKQKLIEILPVYMLPRLIPVDFIPLNPNGKADKKKLHVLSQKEIGIDSTYKSNIMLKLENLWKKLLDYKAIKRTDDFFELGGSSLQVATLTLDIEKLFNIRLPIIQLYENSTLEKLSSLVENKMSKVDSLLIDQTIDILKQDGNSPLPEFDINSPVIQWLNDNEGKIFLTGVTGFLGAFFLADLCNESKVKEVHCLVRAANQKEGLQRIIDNLVKYDSWNPNYLDKIKIIIGHLDQPRFGLDQQLYEELSRQIGCIFHLGAHVNYIQPYSVHKPANVTGTLNILQFAVDSRVKPVHYTSSIAAFGPTGFFNGTTYLSETEDLDRHLNCLKYDTGYSQSQWVAEKIMVRAQQVGFPINIYRPGFIMGDSKKGIGNEKDFVARFIKGCLQIKAFPKLEKQKKEFIAVDYVSQTLLNIAQSLQYGNSFNFVPLNNNESISLLQLHQYLIDFGYDLELVDYSKWVSTLEASYHLQDNPLLPLIPMLKEPVYGDLTRWEVYENMPVYKTDNVKKYLGINANSPTLNWAIIQKYLNYWTETKFITTQTKQLEMQ